jgi:hypothetical protein
MGMNPDFAIHQPVIAVVDPVRIGMGKILFFIANQLDGCVEVLRQKINHVLKPWG